MRKGIKRLITLLLTFCMTFNAPMGIQAAGLGVNQEEQQTVIETSNAIKTATAVEWETLEESNANILYKGNWILEEGAKHSNELGDSVTLEFYGTGIRWIGQRDSNFGISAVTVDNKEPVRVDAYGKDANAGTGKVLFEVSDLEEGYHTFTLKVLREGNPSMDNWGGGYVIDVDKLEVAYDHSASIAPSAITLEAAKTTLKVGQSTQTTVRKAPFNTNAEIVWNIEDGEVVSIDQGVIQATKVGETTITVSAGETVSNEITIEVKDNNPDFVPAELRRVVNNENILYLENFYWTDTVDSGELAWDRDDTPVKLWSTIPDELKPYTAIMLIAEQNLRNKDSVKDWITKYSKMCNDNEIPFVVQVINGETKNSNTIPPEFWEQLALENPYMHGLNGAELYNGPAFFGEDGNYSDYVKEMVDICAKYGMYWVWTDSNCFGTHGVIQDWIEQNQDLSDSLRAYKKNVIMMMKETHATVAAEYLFMGMWLADYCDNWGVSSDFWYWGNQKGGLFGQEGTANTTGDCLIMPEVMYTQSMLRVVSQGGNCFLSEAQFYSNASMGDRTPAYQYAILPFLTKLVSGEIKIPTKEEVMEQNKVVVVGQKLGDRWGGDRIWAGKINYDMGLSQIYPTTAKYGIMASLPSNAPQEALDKFENVFTKLPSKAELDAIYTEDKSVGNAWCENVGDTWYWMNASDNTDIEQNATFVPKISGADSIDISAHPHTYAVVTESFDKMNFHLGNYRMDKSDLANPEWKNFKESQWFTYIWRMSERMFKNTNPDKELRETVITIQSRTEPRLEFVTENNDGTYQEDVYTRPYEYTMDKTNNNEWTLVVKHNGVVEVNVFVLNLNDLNQKIEEASAIEKGNYTDASYKALTDAIEAAKLVVANQDAVQAEVDAQVVALTNAIEGLTLKVNLSVLKAKLAQAESIQKGNYTDVSYKVLTDAIAAAKLVAANPDATQLEVDAQAAALTKAIEGLTIKPVDFSALNAKITQASGIKKGTYTDESFKMLTDAIASAKKTAADKNATQAAVDAQTTALTKAIQGLKEKSASQIAEEKMSATTVNAKAANTGSSKIKLSWDRVNHADGYVISIKSGKSWKTETTLKKNNTTSYTYTKGSLGKSYTFRVKAYKKISGKTIYSNYKPVTKKAIPQTVTVKAKPTKGKVTISFKKVSGVSGYSIEKKIGNKWKKLAMTNSKTLKFTDKDVRKGKKYSYRVKAYKSQKGKKVYGSYSNPITIKAK